MLPVFLYRIKEHFLKIGTKWDELSPNISNAIEFAHMYLNNDPERMISNNVYSLEYCLAHDGERINRRYRIGKLIDIDKEISSMVERYTTKKDIVLYRGVCNDVYKEMCKNARKRKGIDFVEKGFLATSVVKGHELPRDKKLRIYIPAGAHAVYMGNVNDEQHYYEVDVLNGAQMKIVSIDNEYINCRLML